MFLTVVTTGCDIFKYSDAFIGIIIGGSVNITSAIGISTIFDIVNITPIVVVYIDIVVVVGGGGGGGSGNVTTRTITGRYHTNAETTIAGQ